MCMYVCAAAVSPIVIPSSSNGSDTPVLVNPTGPNSIVVPPGNGSATLNDNCTMTVRDSTGKVTYTTNATSTGPCSMVVNPNGTILIIDNGKNSTVWTNNVTANCTPVSLVLSPSGALQEKDCNNNTIWQGPAPQPPSTLCSGCGRVVQRCVG